MRKMYIVTLTSEERAMLLELISSGEAAARKLSHARILLKADSSEGSPGWNDAAISQALDVEPQPLKESAKDLLKRTWRQHWVGTALEENIGESSMVMARPI